MDVAQPTPSLHPSRLARLLQAVAPVEAQEASVVAIAFLCNFMLLGSYYILRPIRDTMATVYGAPQLPILFTGTFLITLLATPLYAAFAARLKLARFIPGFFWLWFVNILIFYGLLTVAPQSRAMAAAYYWWFSVINLFLISMFWTLMADTFSDGQAVRLFPFIAAGGNIGSIAGPAFMTQFVGAAGVGGSLLIAAAGVLVVIFLAHRLIHAKEKLRTNMGEAQKTTLDHSLPGNPLRGFRLLLKSPLLLGQAAFFVIMTWVATIFYFNQIDLIERAYAGLASRTAAFAYVDLAVNIGSALIPVFGLGRLLQRFGVTAGLVLTPAIMLAAFAGLAAAPTLMMVQIARGLQRVTQYAIARPSREILFTVVNQESRYKAKNVIDTTVYRFGDLSMIWMLAGLQALGGTILAFAALGMGLSVIWGAIAVGQGRRFERIRVTERRPAPVAA